MLLYGSRSNIFPQIGVMIWGRSFFKDYLSPFLFTRTTFAFFHSEGNVPNSRQDLKISSKSGKTESPHSIHILIMACPWALFRSRFFIILATLALVTGIDENVCVVFILSAAGISLELSIRVHCWARKLLNDSALSLKFEMNFLL